MNSNLKIRNARKKDAGSIIALVAQFAAYENNKSLFRKRDYCIDGFGRNKFFETLVVFYESKIIGYASYHKGYDMQSASRGIYLVDLFVVEPYREEAVGTALLKVIGQKCMKIKGEWISWHVARTNTKAIRYYKKIGAKRTNSFQYLAEPDSGTKIFPK